MTRMLTSLAARFRGAARAFAVLCLMAVLTAFVPATEDGSDRVAAAFAAEDASIVMAQARPCSDQEVGVVLAHLQGVIEAYVSLQIARYFDVWLDLERRVSTECWLAANWPADERVLRACSVRELNHAASFVKPALQLTRRMLVNGDLGVLNEMQRIGQQAMNGISANCMQTAQIVQLEMQYQQGLGSQFGNVLDHGGGTYSVPGLGSCSSSGCIAFNPPDEK